MSRYYQKAYKEMVRAFRESYPKNKFSQVYLNGLKQDSLEQSFNRDPVREMQVYRNYEELYIRALNILGDYNTLLNDLEELINNNEVSRQNKTSLRSCKETLNKGFNNSRSIKEQSSFIESIQWQLTNVIKRL